MRVGGIAGTVSAVVATSDNTAQAGADYGAVRQEVGFGPGVRSRTVVLPIVEDGEAEGIESLNVAVTSPSGGAVLGPMRTAVVLITDND